MKWRQNICFDFWVQFCTTTTTTPCVLCWNHHHHGAFLNTTVKNHIWKLWQNNTVLLQQNCLRSFADHIHKQTLQFLENCLLLLLRIGDDDLRWQEIKVLRRRREAVRCRWSFRLKQQTICFNRALLHGEIVRAHDVQEHLRELVLMLRLLLSLSLLLETRDITTILQFQESTGSSLVDRRKSVPEKRKTERKRKFEKRAQDEFQDVRLEGECFCRIAMTTKEGRKEGGTRCSRFAELLANKHSCCSRLARVTDRALAWPMVSFCLSHCYDDEEQRKTKLQSLEIQETGSWWKKQITESAGMPEEVHQPEEWKRFCVEENIIWCVCVCERERERERLQELIEVGTPQEQVLAACINSVVVVVVVVVATTIEDDDHGSKIPTDWQWYMDLHMASCCDHRSLLLYKCGSQGFDDPAYACCCDHRYLLYKWDSSSQGFDDDPAYIGKLVVVITDLLLLYKCSGSHQGLTDSVCLHVSLCVCVFVLCQQLRLLSCHFNQGEHKLVLLTNVAVDYILPLAKTHEMTQKKMKSAATEWEQKNDTQLFHLAWRLWLWQLEICENPISLLGYFQPSPTFMKQ